MKSKNFATYEIYWIMKVGQSEQLSIEFSCHVVSGDWRDICNLLINRTIPLRYRSRVYDACVRTTMIYGAA